MSKIPVKFDFKKLKSIPVLQLPEEEIEYTLKQGMTFNGQAVVPKDSKMAAIVLKKKFPKGTIIKGYLIASDNPDVPKTISFKSDGGKMNNGETYKGKVVYTFLLDEAEMTNELSKVVEGKPKRVHFMVKGVALAASVGVGYGIAKLLKKKPLIPMIAAPIVAFAGLLMIDSMMTKK